MGDEIFFGNLHVCTCGNSISTITEDPILDLLNILADEDTLTIVRGLMGSDIRSPFPKNLFDLEDKRLSDCLKALSKSGLINTYRDGSAHVYSLNKNRFKQLAMFFNELSEP